jgi:hypothetical protein
MKFGCGPEAAPTAGSTVLIVGAGPAGIHMASLHKKQGVNAVLLEKANRIGGKSYTIVDDVNVPHELGTCYLHPEYHVPKQLLKEYGYQEQLKPGGPDGYSDIFLQATRAHAAGHSDRIDGWILGAVEEQVLGKDYTLVPDALSILPFLQAIRRYQAAHRVALGKYRGTLPPKPSLEQWALINMTFYDFLKANDCLAMVPLLLMGHVAQGYGQLETLPAFYGLMWFTADLCEAFVEATLHPETAEPMLTMLKGGWSKLWQRMAQQDALDIRLGHTVHRIDRKPDVVTCSGVRADGEAFTFEGSHIFLACPFAPMMSALQLSERERSIFEALRPFCLCTTLYEMDPHPDRECCIAYWPDAMCPDNPQKKPGMLHCERWSAKSIYYDQEGLTAPSGCNAVLATTAEAVSLSDAAQNGSKQVRCSYQFLDVSIGRDAQGNVEAQALREQLESTLSGQGVTGVRILGQYPWDYFYQFSQDQLVKGLPWDLVEMQGYNRTFYIGASACFESVNDVTNYNVMLAEHLFGK